MESFTGENARSVENRNIYIGIRKGNKEDILLGD